MVLESRTRTGDLGEDCAVQHLTSLGYRILARNWRGKRGEVDVIARNGDLAVVVEVKSRNGCGTDLDPAHWMPTLSQQRRIVRAAHDFVRSASKGLASCRFDVILTRTTNNTAQVVRHMKGAFDGSVLAQHPCPRSRSPWRRVR